MTYLPLVIRSADCSECLHKGSCECTWLSRELNALGPSTDPVFISSHVCSPTEKDLKELEKKKVAGTKSNGK